MPVTVREALALPVLAAGDPVVLGGEAGLGRRLRWVHVSEVRDVGALLVGHELVLTTGLGHGRLAGGGRRLRRPAGRGRRRRAGGRAQRGVPARPGAGAAPGPRGRAAGGGAQPHGALRRGDRAACTGRSWPSSTTTCGSPARCTRPSPSSGWPGRRWRGWSRRRPTWSAASVVLEDLSRRVLVAAARDEPVDRLLVDWERRSRLTPYLRASGSGGPERWLTTPVGIQGGAWGRLVQPGRATRGRARAGARARGPGRRARPDDRARRDLDPAARARRLPARPARRPARHRGGRRGPAARARRRRRRGRTSARSPGCASPTAPGRSAAGGLSALARRCRGLVGVLDGGARRAAGPDGADLDAVGARAGGASSPTPCWRRASRSTGVLAAATSLRSARVVADVAAVDAAVRRLRAAGRHPAARAADVAARGRPAAGVRRGRARPRCSSTRPGTAAAWSPCCASSSPSAATRPSSPGSPTATAPRSTPRCAGSRSWSATRLDDPASRLSLGVALLAYDQGRELVARRGRRCPRPRLAL